MPASPRRINISRPGAWLHCYFRVKTCLASIASPPCKPAAWSAFPAGLSGRFHHGNLASIPRVTGSPNGPPKSSGQKPFGTTSTEMPWR